MPEIIVDINIPAQDILQYYKGLVANVSAVALDGQIVQFPVNLLRPFMTYSGVQGRFSIKYNASGKCQEINKL
jgi:hypothetical protein